MPRNRDTWNRDSEARAVRPMPWERGEVVKRKQEERKRGGKGEVKWKIMERKGVQGDKR